MRNPGVHNLKGTPHFCEHLSSETPLDSHGKDPEKYFQTLAREVEE